MFTLPSFLQWNVNLGLGEFNAFWPVAVVLLFGVLWLLLGNPLAGEYDPPLEDQSDG